MIPPSNTFHAVHNSRNFSTTADNQTEALIRIYVGEDRIAKINQSLASLKLTDIPAAPRGVPRIKVTCKLDFNARLTVSATNEETGKYVSVEVVGGPGVPDPLIGEELAARRKMAARSDLDKYAISLLDSADDQGLVDESHIKSEVSSFNFLHTSSEDLT